MNARIYAFAWSLIIVGLSIAVFIWYDNVGEAFNAFHFVIDGMFSLSALWAAGFGAFMIHETSRPSSIQSIAR
jgi:hypothetical protein